MRFAVFCKSFRDDIERFAQLLDSFDRHNASKLLLFACVPRSDRSLFLNRVGSGRAEFLTDEDVLGHELTQSWVSQQLVKLNAFRVNFADAWIWVDSDYYFIRDFAQGDFVRDDGSVAMVASRSQHIFDDHWDALVRFLGDASTIPNLTQEELCVYDGREPAGIPWYSRLLDGLTRPSYASRLRRSAEFFGRTGIAFAALPAAIWTHESLTSLANEMLKPRGLTFEDLLRHSPWEAQWVAEWELFRRLPSRHLIHPPIAHIREDATIRRAYDEGITQARLATRYIGVALAARHQELRQLLA